MTLSKKNYFGALLGIFLEYFDYTLYGFSASYIAVAFFPVEKPAIGNIFTWLVFALGFLLRPIGAFLFGHYADKRGRRTTLMISIGLMSFATLAMGLIPTYQQIGFGAPLLLIICRIVQGLGVSTEYSGVGTYLLEFQKKRRGLFSGIITSASGFGVFAASLLVLLFNSHSFTLPLFANWRWPFILAGISIGLLGSYLRRNLMESPDFILAKSENRLVRFPFFNLWQQYRSTLLYTIVISAYLGIAVILIEVYLPTYLQNELGIKKETALQLSTFLALLEACFAIAWGSLSDYIGQKKVMVIAGGMMIIAIFPLLALFKSTFMPIWFIAAAFLALIVGAIDGPLAAFLSQCFPTEVRYTGFSMSYSLGVAIVGGLSPGLLEFLQQISGLNILPGYLLLGAVCLLLSLSKLKSINHKSRF